MSMSVLSRRLGGWLVVSNAGEYYRRAAGKFRNKRQAATHRPYGFAQR